MKALAILVVACLMLFFPGLGSVPFYTRGEPREALVAREMVTTGEWLVPSRPDGELTRKPPLFYWAAATATTILPTQPELAARLPSAVFATAGVLVTWAVGQAANRSVVPAVSAMSTRAMVPARIHSSDVASTSAAGSATALPNAARPTAQVTRTPAVANTADGKRAASSGCVGRIVVAVAAAQ